MAAKTITIDGIVYELTPLYPVEPIPHYEILAVKDKESSQVIMVQPGGGMFSPDYYDIISLKRLPDGAIFSLCDRIDTLNDGFTNQIISEFEIKGNKILVRYWTGCSYLDNIKTGSSILYNIKKTEAK